MPDLFFFGTLCHAPLLSTVLGRPVALVAATLSDHAVFWAEGQSFPLLVGSPGSVAQGRLARGLDAEDLARLDYYSGGFGAVPRAVTVTAGEPVAALMFVPDPRPWTQGAPWRHEDWAARWGDVVTATAADVMALRGEKPAAEVRARYAAMMVRAASRLRALGGGPTALRHNAQPGDVSVARRTQVYARFFAVEEYDLSWRRFDGTQSATVNRAVFLSGDAVTVLPYDPVRDRVLLIEQFRAGPFGRGDSQPWLLEAIAGRIDPGESPQEAARREAIEEAGITLGAMLPVAEYYPSPGAKSEYLYSYVALADLPDGCAGTFGLETEAEDIRGHLIPFVRLMELVESGEAANAPLILTAYWLQRERPRLRG